MQYVMPLQNGKNFLVQLFPDYYGLTQSNDRNEFWIWIWTYDCVQILPSDEVYYIIQLSNHNWT